MHLSTSAQNEKGAPREPSSSAAVPQLGSSAPRSSGEGLEAPAPRSEPQRTPSAPKKPIDLVYKSKIFDRTESLKWNQLENLNGHH